MDLKKGRRGVISFKDKAQSTVTTIINNVNLYLQLTRSGLFHSSMTCSILHVVCIVGFEAFDLLSHQKVFSIGSHGNNVLIFLRVNA